MTRYLLDTHALIWFLNGDTQLSLKARESIEFPGALKYVSIASLWEISIKLSLGKLTLLIDYSEVYKAVKKLGFELLEISFEDTFCISKLPFLHKDPFDRLLIAQAMNNGLTILTRDQHISSYDVATLW